METLQKRKLQELVKKEMNRAKAFKNPSYFDTLSPPKKILGREEKMKQLISMIASYKQNFVPPLLSVYGRSGTGKSTIVKFVLSNLPNASTCFVNLRKCKTVFGAAKLILDELEDKTHTSNGLSEIIEKIPAAIRKKIETEKANVLFILLDESDAILRDKRGDPSDFFYKLLTIIEDLKKQNYLVSIITISNNLFEQYDLDDRVKSRIGNHSILFEPYSKQEVIDILQEISKKAISDKVDLDVLEYCAEINSSIHGDARRATDLLYHAAKLAIDENNPISKKHVSQAYSLIDSDFIHQFLKTSSFHTKALCYVLAFATFVSGQQWHYTSAIEKMYSFSLPKTTRKLSYRRMSDLLNELEQAGILDSSTKTLGRYGSGKIYRLKFPAEIIGKHYPEKFESWKKMKEEYYSVQHDPDVKYNRDHRLKYDRFEGIREYQKILGQI